METKSMYYWAIVGVAALGTLAGVYILSGYLEKESAIAPGQSVSQKKNADGARVVIDFGNGKKRAFRGEVVRGMTVYDALVASREVGGFSLSFKGDAIDEIGGIKNNSHIWRSYMNGKPITGLPQFEEVKPGDEIVFRFE